MLVTPPFLTGYVVASPSDSAGSDREDGTGQPDDTQPALLPEQPAHGSGAETNHPNE